MRCTLLLAALFAVSWCDLNEDLKNLFNRKCSNWNEMKNRDVVRLLKVNKTVIKKADGEEEKVALAGGKEENGGDPPAEGGEKKEEEQDAEGKEKKEEKQQKNVSMKYYCALTQVARLAQQFNVTGLVQYYRPMRPFSLPTQDVVQDLGKILVEYTPVAVNDEDGGHFPFGCDFGVKSYKKLIPQKKKKKNKKKKKKQKKRYMTVTEYDAYCVVLTDQFVTDVLGQIVGGHKTKDIKAIVDALNKQE